MERIKRPKGSSGSTSELDIYLITMFEFGDSNTGVDFEVIDWWKRHADTFSVLSIIARQILVVPASTTAVERAFSSEGNILDDR